MTGHANTATGSLALVSNINGNGNTATGGSALEANTSGIDNTATGVYALANNTTGNFNTATGLFALSESITGSGNTAAGVKALYATTGNYNTATGYQALYSNSSGIWNTANGSNALYSNTGNFNTATGYGALQSNTASDGNTAIGVEALQLNTTGGLNTAIGAGAGFSVTTGNGNVYVGAFVQGAGAGESNRTYIRNIDTTTVSGTAVTVDLNTGLLGHASSSRRYKEDIKSMDKSSEVLFALKPVSYRFKKEIDQTQSLDYGLIAEDVAKVDPNLTNRNRDGQIESVRYNAINAMLLNEFLNEHRRVQEQEAMITEIKSNAARQEATIAGQQKQIEALSAGLQKVSAQLEVSKAAPQTVLNSQ
jgi:uncharacterized coiled-coil protein SlyX